MAEKTNKGGFGAMDDKQREIQERARKTEHEKGTPQEFISEETRGKERDVVNRGVEDIEKKRDERNR